MSKNPPAVELAALACSLALKAGSTITEMRVDAVSSATTKSSPTDPVTAADTAAEAIIVAGIGDARPKDGIVGEEGTERAGRSGVVWYIDPIDGTTNYLYDIPAYGVSIAAEVDGRVVAGVVYNPPADELYVATAAGGATRNGKPISASNPGRISSSLIATGFGYLAERRRVQAEVIGGLLPEVRDIRRFGSAALDLCSVACGRVDGYFEAGLNSWDFAAGWLIATEAGAVCHNLRDAPPNERFLVAAAPSIDHELTAALRRLEADRVVE